MTIATWINVYIIETFCYCFIFNIMFIYLLCYRWLFMMLQIRINSLPNFGWTKRLWQLFLREVKIYWLKNKLYLSRAKEINTYNNAW